MHEISLVQALLGQLASLAKEHNAASISRVRVEVGAMSGIVVDSFKFGFDALAAEEELTRKAELEVVVPLQEYKCLQCSHVVTTAGSPVENCPVCTATLLVPQGGDDLILLQVEME